MKKIFFIAGLLIGMGHIAHAQFISNGKIEFERKSSVKMMMNYELTDEQKNNEFLKSMMAKMPKDMFSYFELDFDAMHSVYRFVRDSDMKMPMMFGGKGAAKENTVTTYFNTDSIKASKEIYETNFLIADSNRKLNWKIEDEIRVIAGYPCRKAVTTICDSVVIVAFYTDQITVSGGPESINGLPGMILGLAVPRLYTTWFATKVDLVEFKEPEIKPNKKSKTVTYSELAAELQKSVKDWGKYGNSVIWSAML